MGGHAVQSSARQTRRRLERAGFKANQTEALVELMISREERLATKDDLAKVRTELKRDLAELRASVANNTTRIEGLERAMEALRQEVRDRFESFRREIAGQLDGMRGQIDGLRGELRVVKWILGGMFALMVPMLGGIIGIALQLGQR